MSPLICSLIHFLVSLIKSDSVGIAFIASKVGLCGMGMELEQLKYPVGRFVFGKAYSLEETEQGIACIQRLPANLEKMASLLTENQLLTSYREGGWTARQLINHLADVYVNAYMRTKWALTENVHAIKTYDENASALLPDSDYMDLPVSVAMVTSTVKRWVFLLNALSRSDWKKALYHPEYKMTILLDELIQMYAWHGEHHLAHLEIIRSHEK